MASFTDNPQLLTNFNPYVQQLPVDAMREVGMYKQAKYDEGVQKIQTTIDNVAGLDVVRDIDKGYLQSKLNELGNNLKTVAAGDFSNFQLVNSTAGMANAIAKDATVQNAVMSSAKYRKGMQEMEAAIKEGKASPSNNWLFNKSASDWLYSKDINSKFGDNYQTYTNWKKNGLEVIKALTKDSTITENAFTTDKNGNIVIADAIVRQKLAGISPEKIQEALMVGLTPADFKQMEIDGRYNYSNMDDKSFITAVDEKYNSQKEAYSNHKKIIEDALLKTNSASDKDKLKGQIKSIDDILKKLSNEYDNVTETISSGDVESAKAKLGTITAMHGFSKAFSFTESESTYGDNPLADMKMRRETKAQEYNLAIARLEQDDRHFAISTELEKKKIKISQEANDLKRGELEGYGGLPVDIDQKDLPKYTMAKLISDTNGKAANLEKADAQFIKQNKKDEAWLDSQREAWLKRPGSVDPLIAEHFNNTEGARREVESNMSMISTVSKDATKRFGDIYQKIPANAPNIVITSASGVKTTFTPREFVDFNNIISKYSTVETTPGGGQSMSGGTSKRVFNDAAAKADLTPKQLMLYNIEKARYYGGDKALNNAQKTLYANVKNYNNKVNVPYSKTIDQINDYTTKVVADRLTVTQGLDYAIPTGNAAQKTSIASMLTSFANLAEKQKGKLPNSPNFTVGDAREIATDSEAKYNIKVAPGSSIQAPMYEVTATGKNKTVQFKITAEQKQSIFGNMFEASNESRAAQPYIEQIRKTGGYSTSIDGSKYLSKIDFPSTSIYGVTGNIVTPNNGQSYSIRLDLYDPLTKKLHEDIPYPRTGLVSKEAIVPAMQNLSDSAVFELIYGRPATANDLKKIKEASKKPF
jgi:hypothetical protein